MGWKKRTVPIIIGILGSFLYVQNEAFSSNVYFTPQVIKGQIIHAIEGCRESIDIATLDITSIDILNALVKAQERGVHVRIVIDRKRTLVKGPLSNLNKDKKFAIKVLIQKGRMHNNFAIFDSQLLATGSYYWNEKMGKYDRYDTIFTEETKLLMKYQKEFDLLFHGEAMVSGQEEITISEKKGEKVEGVPAANIPKVPDIGAQVITSNYGFVITETSNGYINMNFEEFNEIFGMTSELSDEQKESLWRRCVGKRVKWRGTVSYIGWGLITGWMMSATHGDTGVEVKLNSANKAHFSPAKYGNTVTYTGKLNSRVTRVFPYKLEDGDVLEIENTPLRQLTYDELRENPDVVPISQGPKKIFLIDSFDDLDNIFGKGSKLSEVEKDKAWDRYKGKYVSWEGQIIYKNLNVASGLRMRIGIMQKEKGDVELKVGMAKKNKVLKFQDGETISFTGKLAERCGILSPYILEDGDILTIKESNIETSGM